MSTSETLTLILAYVLPVALAIGLLVNVRLGQASKVLLMLVLPLFYIAHYQALSDLLGWPSKDPLPESFVLLGHQIKEPDKRSNDPGEILLWSRAMDSTDSRLYSVAYTRELHQQLIASDERKAQGTQQMGTRQQRSGEHADGSPYVENEGIEIRDMRPPTPPAKLDAE